MEQIATPWGEELNEEHVLSEYPRPQMERKNWTCLNGYWEYAFTGEEEGFPLQMEGKILVPFSPESLLSGVGRQLMPDEFLWYQKRFRVSDWEHKRDRTCLLLHFGAVDQICTVYINGREAGSHTGGYLSFSFDITSLVLGGINEILVKVQDLSDTSCHARGKQKLKRGGMFYTAVSGIWQSVWMEAVPKRHFSSLEITPDLDGKAVSICPKAVFGKREDDTIVPVTVKVFAPLVNRSGKAVSEREIIEVQGFAGRKIRVSIPDHFLRPWTPEHPWLYPVEVRMEGTGAEDTVRSYFAVRSIAVEKVEENGKLLPRICLNHKPIFLKGVLDQGWWPDGMMTAPSDEAMIFDIRQMIRTGFNMVRKHLKIEPDRWYYHCDRMGLIVWQDMVNGGGPIRQWFVTYIATFFSLLKVPLPDGKASRFVLSRTDPEGRAEFEREMGETVSQLKNHPSICVWGIFNEGWGQFDAERMTELLRKLDPDRLIDSTSGWFDERCGDFLSVHNYFFPYSAHLEKDRAYVLSEIGGKVWSVPEHSTGKDASAYHSFKSRKALNDEYRKIDGKMRELIPKGLCATIYTQWTDIEDEQNGVYTYDRKVRKIDPESDEGEQ